VNIMEKAKKPTEELSQARKNSLANLRSFTSEHRPTNPGRKPGSITSYLRQIGQSKEVSYEIIFTKENGVKQTKKGKVESPNTINQLLATLMYNDAVAGDTKARKEILDRTEGKAQQNINLEGNVGNSNGPKYDLTKVSDAALEELAKAIVVNEEDDNYLLGGDDDQNIPLDQILGDLY